MKAMVIPRFGGPEVFESREVDRPGQGPGQVLVRVLATASGRNQEIMRELGADVTIDYTREDAAEVALRETGGQGVDGVLEEPDDPRRLPHARARAAGGDEPGDRAGPPAARRQRGALARPVRLGLSGMRLRGLPDCTSSWRRRNGWGEAESL